MGRSPHGVSSQRVVTCLGSRVRDAVLQIHELDNVSVSLGKEKRGWESIFSTVPLGGPLVIEPQSSCHTPACIVFEPVHPTKVAIVEVLYSATEKAVAVRFVEASTIPPRAAHACLSLQTATAIKTDPIITSRQQE